MADPKKIGFIVKDLKAMKKILVPNDDDDVISEEEMKAMDKFQKQKLKLNGILRTVREDTGRLTELRKRLGPDTRDANCIRIMNETKKALKTASDMWQDLKVIYAADQKKRGKKLGEKELSSRNREIQLLGEEIVSLTSQSARVKSSAPSSVEELDEQRGRSRTQKQKQRDERADRLTKRKQRRAGKSGMIELNDDAFKEAAPVTQQEQQFMDQVGANVSEQNEMLDEIGKGLDELKELSLDMNKQLSLQEDMVEELGEELEKTIDNFKSANGKLKDMLDENGGMTRWCPTIVCVCLLLSLIGYMFKLF